MSTHLEAVVNPLAAACEEGYLPEELHVLENPGVGERFDDIIDIPRKVTVSWDELKGALYTLVVLFGVLQLPKVTLFGVWNGVTGANW